MFNNEPTVVTEDVTSRVWLISDIRSTEVVRLGVRAEFVWETIFFDADTRSSV